MQVQSAEDTVEQTDGELDPSSLFDEDDPFAHEDAEASIADAMASLSVEERERSLLETHGVAEVQDEDDAFIDQKLADLECELLKIPNKTAYYMAKSTSPAYVCDRKFRLMFLRADQYDCAAAARRLVSHFDTKLDLFGTDYLGKNIRLSDLDEEDLNVMSPGIGKFSHNVIVPVVPSC